MAACSWMRSATRLSTIQRYTRPTEKVRPQRARLPRPGGRHRHCSCCRGTVRPARPPCSAPPGPGQHDLHGALDLGALSEAQAQALCLLGDAYQRPAHQRRQLGQCVFRQAAGGHRACPGIRERRSNASSSWRVQGTSSRSASAEAASSAGGTVQPSESSTRAVLTVSKLLCRLCMESVRGGQQRSAIRGHRVRSRNSTGTKLERRTESAAPP